MSEGPRLVSVGRVLGAYGLRGEVKAELWIQPGDLPVLRFFVFIKGIGKKELQLERYSERKHYILKFKGIDDRELAEALVGLELMVPRDELPPKEEGEFYQFELLGLRIVGPGGESLGRVEALVEGPGYYFLQNERGDAWPLTERFVEEIDLEGGFVKLRRLA